MINRNSDFIFWSSLITSFLLFFLIIFIEPSPCRKELVCDCVVDQTNEFTIKFKGVEDGEK